MSLLQLVLAILFPPISVFLQTGFGVQLLINVLLTLIGWLPGVIHALWVGFSGPRPVHA